MYQLLSNFNNMCQTVFIKVSLSTVVCIMYLLNVKLLGRNISVLVLFYCSNVQIFRFYLKIAIKNEKNKKKVLDICQKRHKNRFCL